MASHGDTWHRPVQVIKGCSRRRRTRVVLFPYNYTGVGPRGTFPSWPTGVSSSRRTSFTRPRAIDLIAGVGAGKFRTLQVSIARTWPTLNRDSRWWGAEEFCQLPLELGNSSHVPAICPEMDLRFRQIFAIDAVPCRKEATKSTEQFPVQIGLFRTMRDTQIPSF